MACHKAGRLAEAERLYKQILKAEPDHPQALHFLGVAADQMDRHEEAVEQYALALVTEPVFVRTYLAHATSLAALGRIEEARGSWLRARELAGDGPEAAAVEATLQLIEHQ